MGGCENSAFDFGGTPRGRIEDAMSKTEKDKAVKKVQIAIDKMIGLQDMGLNSDIVTRVLEMLNSLETEIQSR